MSGISTGFEFSVILPTWNEAGNAARLVAAIRDHLSSTGRRFEILVLDDDSSDDTLRELQDQHGSDPRVKIHSRQGRERGLALSILDGIHLATGAHLIVMDSDFNHDPSVIPQMVLLMEYYDIVSGSRFSPGGGMQSRGRYWCSFVFNAWIRVLLMMPTRDNLAGFYCIRRSCMMEYDLGNTFKNYGDYFFRLLYQARRLRHRLLEIPVWYRERDFGQSKTRFIPTLMLYTREALRVRRLFRSSRPAREGKT